jgi:large subunit ribosomal protein L29
MKAAEIRDMDTEDLHGRIAELKEEIFNLRFQHATGQLDNHRRMRQCKQDIARIRTILRERDFAALQAAAPAPVAAAPAAAEAVAAEPVAQTATAEAAPEETPS